MNILNSQREEVLAEQKYTSKHAENINSIEAAKLETLKAEMYEQLSKIIIPFWQSLRDEQYGGFYGEVSSDLVVNKKADKACVLNSRILWFFSSVYTLNKTFSTADKAEIYPEDILLDCAKHAFEFLINNFYDKSNGGVFWSVNYSGTVADNFKHTYNIAFAIYALSAYYEASHDLGALQLALELFKTVESHCRDAHGYLEEFDCKFNAAANDKLSENGVIADRTMNTNLHLLEAYTELYRMSRDVTVEHKIIQLLDIFSTKIYEQDKKRLKVFMDKNYNSILDLHSFGHDIEASWLLDRACDVLEKYRSDAVSETDAYKGKSVIAANREISSNLAGQVLLEAFDGNSMANEAENNIVDKTRVWWVQAETVTGFFNLWQKDTRQYIFLEASLRQWEFIQAHLVDPRPNSEWFAQTDEYGAAELNKPIVDAWKCPYHNGRMCIEVIKRINGIENSDN